MKGMVRGGLTAAILVAAMAASPVHASANAFCRWEPTVLPLPPGFSEAGLEAADGNEWSAGWLAPDGSGPFVSEVGRWHDGAAESIGTPFGGYVDIEGINSAGVVVGLGYDASFGMRPVVYRDGAWATLPAPGPNSRATDVNTAGDVVGIDASEGEGNNWTLLVVWPKDGPRRVLTLPNDGGLPFGTPKIDDDGTVVAPFYKTSGGITTIASYVYPNGTSQPRALTPLRPGDGFYVTDLRNGRIVGENYAAVGATTGVQWDKSGAVQRTFPGRPAAVSVSGAVTGMAEPSYLPVVWGQGNRGAALPRPAGSQYAFSAGFSGEQVAGYSYGGAEGTKPTVWDMVC